MTISHTNFREYLRKSSVAESVFLSAKKSGFLVIADDKIDDCSLHNRDYHTLRAAITAGITDLNQLDDFIKINHVDIQQFFIDLRIKNEWVWTVCGSFLYELIILFRNPEVFTQEYQSHGSWGSRVADNVEYVLSNFLSGNETSPTCH